MIRKYIVYLLIMTLGLVLLPAAETENPEVEDKGTEALVKKCKKRIVGAPIVFYTPETTLGFGAAGSLIFRFAGCDKNTRPSSISPVLIYTLEKQFRGLLKGDFFFKDNNYRLTAEIKLEKYPNKFFGVGSGTVEEDEEVYTSRSSSFVLSFLKKIGRGFNGGIRYHFMNWEMVETEEGGRLAGGEIAGSEDGTLSGAGLIVNRDTRDNLFFPTKGDFFELNAVFYNKFMGSDFNFSMYTLNLRKYITVFSNHVFAVQTLVQSQTGTVPFMNLARIGGQYNMRGYFEGRFRDKNLLVLQADYRVPLFWRIGVVGFAGVGNVAEKFNRLNLQELKFSYGFGLRFLFDKKERIWVRLDVGFGKDSSGFYASVFEAF